MIKAIIFDLDDTLYPEKEFVMSGFWAVARYLGKKYKLNPLKILAILKKDFEKGRRGNNFNLLLSGLNFPKKEVGKLVTIYRSHKPKIKLFSDAKKLLGGLSKSVKKAIVSDGQVTTQKNKLEALKINKIFDAVVLSDSLGKKYQKPHPKPFQIALKKIKTPPKEAIYVADNPEKDFIGAKKLGMFTVQIKRKRGIYAGLKAQGLRKPDVLITNLLRLKDYVK